MYWLSIRTHSCCWAECVSRGVLFMTVTILTLDCTHKHRTSGGVYPLALLEIASIVSLAWGKYFYITFIVLSSQFFIYFVSKCRIPLIRLICLVFLFKMIFCPSMASTQGGPFFPAPTESRILSQLQCGVAIDQIIKSWVFLFFYCLLFQFVYLSGDFAFFP